MTVDAVTWVEESGRQAFHDRCLATGAMLKQVLQGRIPGHIRCLQLYIEFVPYTQVSPERDSVAAAVTLPLQEIRDSSRII